MSGRAIVTIHGDGNLANSPAKLSIAEIEQFGHLILYS